MRSCETVKPKQNKWTDEENMQIKHAIKTFGKDYDKISAVIQSKSQEEIVQKCNQLMRFQGKDSAQHMDVQPILEQSCSKNVWSDEETDLLVEGLKQHGKNYTKLQ